MSMPETSKSLLKRLSAGAAMIALLLLPCVESAFSPAIRTIVSRRIAPIYSADITMINSVALLIRDTILVAH